MHSRLVRILLVFIGIGIGLASAQFLRQLDKQIADERTAIETARARAVALTATLADARTGQVAYVAQGQGEAFWIGHVARLLPMLETQTADFRASLMAPAAQSAYDGAAAAIENFQKLDIRVREFVASGNKLLASDLIFADGVEATATATSEVNSAVEQETLYRQATMTGLRNRQLQILAAGSGGMLLLLVALGLTGGGPKEIVLESQPSLSLRTAPEKTVAPPAPVPAAPPQVQARPGLVNAAKLCTDFARVLEAEQLPSLLERTARLIDASGVIVWIADPEARVLRPAMAHGYTDQFISRMGTIHLEASNAAASAYRASQMRTVGGDKINNGAIVAPLLTPIGCIGVLSAEMKGGSEKDESSQALAAIFAAQLATIVSPPPQPAAEPVRAAAQA